MRFPRPSSCSCSRRGGAVNGSRPGGEGERGGGLDGPGRTGGNSRRTGGRLIVIVKPPWDSPARAEGGESDIRKPYLFLSSFISSGIAARAFPLLISLAFSSSTNSLVISPRALAFLYVVFFLYIFLGTTSGILIGICISSLRYSAVVISLDNPLIN